MKTKLITSILALALAAAMPLSALATNEYRSAAEHRLERVPIQNTEAHVSDSYKRFSDVPDSYWGKDGISYVVDKGLFNGTGYGMFSPEMPMNRAMICTVLHRFAGSPAVSGESGYSDVKSGEWYSDGVTWAKQQKILTRDLLNSAKLEPERGLTRGDFAVMVRNYYEVSTGDIYNDAMGALGLVFPDLPVNNYEVTWAMAWLYTYSILNGTGENTMSPDWGLTRSQMAAMLERYDRQFGAGAIPSSDDDETTTTPSKTSDTHDKGFRAWDGRYISEEEVEDELIRLINDYRAENGLQRLNKNEKLMKAADIRASEAMRTFSHTRPDGTFAATVLEEVGYSDGGSFLENLYSSTGALATFNAWKESPGHNGSMLAKDMKNIGVGYDFCPDGAATVLIVT